MPKGNYFKTCVAVHIGGQRELFLKKVSLSTRGGGAGGGHWESSVDHWVLYGSLEGTYVQQWTAVGSVYILSFNLHQRL